MNLSSQTRKPPKLKLKHNRTLLNKDLYPKGQLELIEISENNYIENYDRDTNK